MKKNLPVTTQQVDIAPGITLVSKTDLKGIITYANEAFINVSGFALEALQGHSHNIVRHPDMPPAVFESMWKVLHSGKPWQGLVKNRCKNGDFYWVDACVVPVRRNEQTIGYMSVRKRAEPAAVAHAQALFYQPITIRGMPPTWKLPPWLGIRFGMRAGTIFVALLMLAGGALGIGGLKLADAAFARLHHQQFEPAIGQLGGPSPAPILGGCGTARIHTNAGAQCTHSQLCPMRHHCGLADGSSCGSLVHSRHCEPTQCIYPQPQPHCGGGSARWHQPLWHR